MRRSQQWSGLLPALGFTTPVPSASHQLLRSVSSSPFLPGENNARGVSRPSFRGRLRLGVHYSTHTPFAISQRYVHTGEMAPTTVTRLTGVRKDSSRAPSSSSASPRSASTSKTRTADALLSQWSRRPHASPSASPAFVSTVSSTAAASPSANQRDALSDNSLRVEDLLEFGDEGEAGGTPDFSDSTTGPHQSAQAESTIGSEAAVDEDADVYGAAAPEHDLMQDLLQQATMTPTASASAEDAQLQETEDRWLTEREGDGPSSESVDANPTAAAVDASFNTSTASRNPVVAAPVLAAAEDEDLARSPRAPAERAGSGDRAADSLDEEKDEEAALAASDRLGEEEAEEEEEEGDEASMDTVLEEETEKMLQAALANMLKESTTRAARATAAASPAKGSDGKMSSAAEGTGGYTFFPAEAVRAAVESLAASERAARSAGNSTGGAAPAAVGGAAEEAGANFDDDAVRAAEMDSVGLDMETAKRT